MAAHHHQRDRPRGERLRAGVPHGHWKTTTFVGALTLRGFIAPWVLDGPINRNAFETYVAKVLVPELRPGDVVVMDDLLPPQGAESPEMIEAIGTGCRYLPPRPQAQPIEMAFSKLEALLRKAAERTVDGLNTIGRFIDLFKPDECRKLSNTTGLRCILIGKRLEEKHGARLNRAMVGESCIWRWMPIAATSSPRR